MRPRGSVGGVTVGNGWMYNNPDLAYPDGHEDMDEATLEKALRVEPLEFIEEKPKAPHRKTPRK